MAEVVEDVRGLLSLLLVICVLLLVMWMAAPVRGGKEGSKRRAYRYRARRDRRILGLYDIEDQLLGPLVVAMLLLRVVADHGPSLWDVCLATGVVMGVANRFKSFWAVLLYLIAGTGLVLQWLHLVDFVAEPHEAGLLAPLYKLSMLLLVWACFSLGALLSTPWSKGLNTKALSFVVILELILLVAEPAFEVSLANPPLMTVTWGFITCGVVAVLGFFSFPITLDLLALGTALALWFSTAGQDYLPVLIGVLLGLVARAVTGLLTRG